MYCFTKGVQANENRNIKTYPIIDTKVDKLVNSIKKTGESKDVKVGKSTFTMNTGFWDNINFYVDDPKLQTELEAAALLPMDKQLELSAKLIKGGHLFQANGHHRMVAIHKVGIDIINVPVRYMDEETRLHVMILENLESFGGTTFTTLESHVQACKFIMKATKNCDNFADYQKKGNTAFSSAKQYSAAIKSGLPSLRVLQAFFGNAMPKNTIEAALKAVQNILAGVYITEMIQDFPSNDVLRMFNSLTTKLLKTTIPVGVLTHLIADCAETIVANKTAGRDIVAATNRIEAGTDPLPMLKNGIPKEFVLYKYLVKLIRSNVDVRELQGMDSDDAKKALAVAEKYIKDQEIKQARDARREALMKAGKTPQEIVDTLVKEGLMTRPPAPEIPDDATPEERQAIIDEDAETNAGISTSDPSEVDPNADPDTQTFDPSAEGPINVPDRTSAKSIMNYAHSSMQITGRQLTNLIGRVEEAKNSIESDGMVDTFFPSIEKTFKILVYLMIEHVGVDGVRKVVNASAKVPADEAGLDVKAA